MADKPAMVVNKDTELAKMVANSQSMVVNMVANADVLVANRDDAMVANSPSRHGKYADPAKRKAYMRDYMTQRRASAH